MSAVDLVPARAPGQEPPAKELQNIEAETGQRHGTGTRVVKVLASAVAILFVLVVLVASIGFLLGYRMSPVLSGSMRPTFAPGDAIITRAVPVSSIRRGMIVEFTPPGETTPYAHRVLTVSGNPSDPVITTKGDANRVPDGWHVQLSGPTVLEEVAVVPGAGRVMTAIHGPGLGDFAVAAFGLLVTASGLAMFVSAFRRNTGPQPTT